MSNETPGNSNDATSCLHVTGFVVILVAATLSIYSNSFDGTFLFDDTAAIVENDSIRSIWPPTAMFDPPPDTTVSGRPLVNATLAANFAIGGLDTWGYHAVNLLLHLAAGLLLFLIVGRTLRLAPLAGRFRRHADRLAFFVALLWLVHPLQTESVTYVVQRAESLVGLFYGLALYTVMRVADSPTASRWSVIAVIAVVLGTLSKEVMATAPFVIYAFDALLLCGGRWREPLTRRRRLYACFAVTLVIPVWLIITNPRGDSAGFGVGGIPTPLEYLATQPGVILHYLQLSIWPASLCIDYGWPVASNAGEILLPGLVVMALLVATIWAAIARKPVAILGIWFFAILAPTSSFVPIADLAFEHRMYLPLAAVIALVVLVTYRCVQPRDGRVKFSGRVAVLTIVGVALAVALGMKTRQRNRDYASAAIMWADVAAKRPDNARGHHNLANALQQTGDYDGAVQEYRRALAVDAERVDSRNDLGVLLSEMGRHAEGLALVREAIERDADHALFHYNLGNILARMGRDDEAAAAFRSCLELEPNHADALYNLGNIALRRKDFDAAAAEFRLALTVDPDHIRANFNLGGILRMEGDGTGAAIRLRRAYDAALRQGRKRAQLGQWSDAVELFQLAAQIDPARADAKDELANALENLGRMNGQ